MWGQPVFKHSFMLCSAPPGPWLGGVVAHAGLPPRAFSCPLGRSLQDQANWDYEAGHGDRTSTHGIYCFTCSAMVPECMPVTGVQGCLCSQRVSP